MISFSIGANSFSGICLFCISVRNKIYVMEIEMLEPVFMERNTGFDKPDFREVISMYQSSVIPGLLVRYHKF